MWEEPGVYCSGREVSATEERAGVTVRRDPSRGLGMVQSTARNVLLCVAVASSAGTVCVPLQEASATEQVRSRGAATDRAVPSLAYKKHMVAQSADACIARP